MIDRIGALDEAGVTWTSLPTLNGGRARSVEGYLEGLEWAAKEVMAHFR
jgi:hypothetical protein